jgi:flavocytochrome c
MSPKAKKNQMNRREFLKGAAAAGATVAAASMFGPFAPTALAAGNVPEKWDETYDVVVIGTGVAGYGAAIEAKDAGSSVVIIEKESWYGGNSLLAGGNMQFPVNHIQKAANIADSAELATKDIMEMGDYRNMPEIVKLFVDNSADTALWLEKLGIVWNKTVSKQDGCSVPRTLIPAPAPGVYPLARGLSEIAVLHKAATDRKIPVKLSTKMTSIIRADSKSPVLGIEVSAGGKTAYIKANKAVILATGGFKANHQMKKALDPRLDEPWTWSGWPYVNTVGDGHFAAAAVGAGFVDMSFVCEFNFTIGSNKYCVWEPQTMDGAIGSGGLPMGAAGLPFILLVDNDGNRYANEATFGTSHVTWKSEHLNSFLALPKRPRVSWTIVDADGAKALTWTAEIFNSADPNKGRFLDPKMTVTAGTIAELAGKMGIPAANLQATIDKWNGYVTAGADKDFKRPAPLNPIKNGPFYAALNNLGTHDQCAGMRVNSKMQVIDATFQATTGVKAAVALDQEPVIPHLYGAGEINGGLFGADRGSGKMGAYLVEGRFAGKNAAAEKPLT